MNDTATLDLLFERWLDGFKVRRQTPITDLCKDRPELLAALHERVNAHLASTNSLPPETRTSDAGIDTPERSGVGGPPSLTPPCDFGPYRIEKQLGAGGMGAVYLARETHLNRDVALKVMLPRVAASGEAKDRFLNEARAMAALEHDHVVPVYRADEINGIPFLAMPLLRGESLETRLKREKTLPAAEVIRIGSEMARGLAAAHAHGLIHRDIKPANTWMEAGTGRVKILDFGIAAATVPGSPGQGGIVGSPPYMSPEQTRGGPLDERSDVYSLGVTLYEMASGKRPSDRGTAVATMQAIANEQPRPPHELHPDVPAPLSALIMRLLEKDPARRPPSAAAVVEELRQLQQSLLAESLTVGAAKASPRWPSSHADDSTASTGIRRRALAVIGIVLIGFGLVWYATRGPGIIEPPVPGEEPKQVVEKTAETPLVPLRVKKIDVTHFQPDRPEGRLLGSARFDITPDDQITVDAVFSRPAHAYLIVFRPDGTSELCYPESEDITPGKSDRARYPSERKSQELGKQIGLNEGTGLYVVAAVLSDAPLPPFREWKKRAADLPRVQKGDWHSGAVWWDDGEYSEMLPANGAAPIIRGVGKASFQKAPTVTLLDELKRKTAADRLAGLGFVVMPKKKG